MFDFILLGPSYLAFWNFNGENGFLDESIEVFNSSKGAIFNDHEVIVDSVWMIGGVDIVLGTNQNNFLLVRDRKFLTKWSCPIMDYPPKEKDKSKSKMKLGDKINLNQHKNMTFLN